MAVNINDLAITSIETITGFDIVTGDYIFTLDELQNATIGHTEEKQDVLGKQGRKITSLKRNKAVTISGTNGLISGGLLEMQTGGQFESKQTEVLWTDYLTVSGDAATTNYLAVGTVGNEIEAVYAKNPDGTLATKLTQDATAGEGTFAYAPASKAITFNAGQFEEGADIVVMYKRTIQASVLENFSDKYSKVSTLYVDAIAEDKCANLFRVQFFIPKASFDGNFEIAMGDTATVHAFNAEALAGACGASAALWTYTVFGAEAEDA